MLVLSRKKNQGILIRGKEGDIRVVVLDADKGKLRLGIKAPGGYTIVREELVLETEDANRRSAVDGVEELKGSGWGDTPLADNGCGDTPLALCLSEGCPHSNLDGCPPSNFMEQK